MKVPATVSDPARSVVLHLRPHRIPAWLLVLPLLLPAEMFGSESGDGIIAQLRGIKGAFVKEVEPARPYNKAYEIWLNQPIDHHDPAAGTFQQRIFISHISESAPTVVFTDGYAVTWPKKRELATLLRANKIEVEHRFFGVSKPGISKLEYFTSWQAASDHHRIITLIRPIYDGKWISSGKSLGGMAAYIHRSHFPDDVDVTVSFVAPLMSGRDDPRFLEALKSDLGDDMVSGLERIQIELLKNRERLEAAIRASISPDDIFTSFSEMLEYSVLNMPFDVYEKHLAGSIGRVPDPDSGIETLLSFFLETVDLSYFLKSNAAVNQGVHHQTATELGFYNYPRTHLNALLTTPENLDCSIFSPGAATPRFDPQPMRDVLANLRKHDSRMIYIYGEKDIWTAGAVDTAGMKNSVRIIQSGADHNVRLDDLSPEYQEVVAGILAVWLGIDITFPFMRPVPSESWRAGDLAGIEALGRV